MLLKQTKIVATISDKRCDVDFIKGLFEAGMNVVRTRQEDSIQLFSLWDSAHVIHTVMDRT